MLKKMSKDYILIKLKKPIRDEYHSTPDCAPKQRGDGCYGDCIDCFHIDRERYERISKFQAAQNSHGN